MLKALPAPHWSRLWLEGKLFSRWYIHMVVCRWPQLFIPINTMSAARWPHEVAVGFLQSVVQERRRPNCLLPQSHIIVSSSTHWKGVTKSNPQKMEVRRAGSTFYRLLKMCQWWIPSLGPISCHVTLLRLSISWYHSKNLKLSRHLHYYEIKSKETCDIALQGSCLWNYVNKS